MPNWKTQVGRVRLVGMIEGVSFLLLMGVAMPLKYLAGMPEAVKVAGWCHGVFFILYGMAVLSAWSAGKLTFAKSAMAFIASLIPFGPFLVDGKLAEVEMPNTEG